ncbi:MAG: Uma2 family endonuclease [Verrucomicrobiaceae bacterium]|nr:Uma2 family endonuclease [Verrucomicrobiaceae bacterium]
MHTWEQLCEDKRFKDLPYKIETNARGQIIMSPAWMYHGSNVNRIARLLESFLSSGEVIVECAVDTADGVKEADTAWLSDALWDKVKDQPTCSPAPEICVEVISKSNSLEEMMYKRQLYIGAGAKEYWLCDKEGNMRFFDGVKELESSILCPEFPKLLPPRR